MAIFNCYVSSPEGINGNFNGNITTKYGQKYGTFAYLHVLDPGIPIEYTSVYDDNKNP
jgi:hypothetical protein